jgi:CoA-transferase family III
VNLILSENTPSQARKVGLDGFWIATFVFRAVWFDIIHGMPVLLDGIQVVELSEALARPYCVMILGDFGADVIKVERPGIGDHHEHGVRRF